MGVPKGPEIGGLSAGDWMLDAGCGMLDAGYWMLDAGSLGAGYWVLACLQERSGGRMRDLRSVFNFSFLIFN